MTIDEMKIKREVSNLADILYGKAIELGDHAADAFEGLNKSEKRRHRSQMTGLENIAESTLKVSDVLDYIKKQTARRDYWRKPSQKENKGFGVLLKEYLEGPLSEQKTTICNRLGINDQTDPDGRERRRIHLLLIRQLIRQLVVQYEFRASEIESTNRGANDDVDQ